MEKIPSEPGVKGKPGAKSDADKEIKRALDQYKAMYPSGMFGREPGTPEFMDWYTTEWPSIRRQLGFEAPVSSESAPGKRPPLSSFYK